MTIDPASTTPQNLYKLLIGSVIPRPIAFVSSLSETGVANLAPFSFFTVASANPPVIGFVPLVPAAGSRLKDTLQNVRAIPEFVVNIVSEDFTEQMNLCSGDYPPEISEFTVSGLTPVASDLVRPPRVAESRIQMECRLQQIVEVSTKPLGGSIVLGEVVRFHLDDTVADAALRIDPAALQAVGRMGGPSYTRTRDIFHLERPVVR